MGANNPNNQMYGFPNEYVVNSNTQNLGSLITIGGAGLGAFTGAGCTAYRFGDRLIAQGTVLSGTVAASNFWIQLPPGLTVNMSLSPALTPFTHRYGMAGNVSITASIVNICATGIMYVVFCDGVNKDRLYLAWRQQSGAYLQDAANSSLATGDRIDYYFDVPIEQWAV